jgi:hypothetical protein
LRTYWRRGEERGEGRRRRGHERRERSSFLALCGSNGASVHHSFSLCLSLSETEAETDERWVWGTRGVLTFPQRHGMELLNEAEKKGRERWKNRQRKRGRIQEYLFFLV